MRTDRLDEAKSLFTVLRIRLRSRQASINSCFADRASQHNLSN